MELTAVGVSQSHREIPLYAGSSVWTAMERAAMAANLVTFCRSTEHLERTERLSSDPEDLAGILHASSLPLGRPAPMSALLLVVLQLETSRQICRPHARGSATAAPLYELGSRANWSFVA